MRKLFASILLAVVCMSAMAQNNPANEITKGTKWKVALQASVMYNYNFATYYGRTNLSKSGFGLEVAPLLMEYQAWKGGSITIGLLDMFFDFQYLPRGYRFDGVGSIIPAAEGGKGDICDITFSVPVGINQQFNEDWGFSLTAATGIGLVNLSSHYIENGFQHDDNFHSRANRVGFRLDVKANIWYQDFGLIIRYRPLASKNNPYGSPVLSGGIAFRF